MIRGITEHLGYSINDGVDMIIYARANKFLEYDPPCKECLVQAICLNKECSYFINYEKFGDNYIELISCDILIDFVTNSNFFTKF